MSRPMRDRLLGAFARDAEHLTVAFLPEPGGAPLDPYQGYLRLWLAEGFLAKAATWGNKHFPALHGGVSLDFRGDGPAPFTQLVRPAGSWNAPGVRLDYPMTPLLPYAGAVVEVEAALFRATAAGPLATAVQIAGGLAELIAPPLTGAAAIAGKLAEGLDAVLAATGDTPVLALHWAMTPPGGGGNVVRPGHLVLVGSPPAALSGALVIVGGRLHVDAGRGPVPLDGVDYLVLRVECRRERPDWRLPQFDAYVKNAATAAVRGYPDQVRDIRTEAVCAAWNCDDLTPVDRRRVAALIGSEIDALAAQGAVGPAAYTFDEAARARLMPRDAPELDGLTLDAMLRG